MKLNIKKFMMTEMGGELEETIKAWDQALEAIRQFYGIEFNFTRTDEYFGICNDDETIWLMKENRKEERQ